jgi:hypothetical protein
MLGWGKITRPRQVMCSLRSHKTRLRLVRYRFVLMLLLTRIPAQP